MRRITIFLLFLLASPLVASDKIALDRIDATIGISAKDNWPELLMKKTADTGVKNIKIWAPWVFMDPHPPFAEKPSEEEGYMVVPGKRVEGWHIYFVGVLDKAMQEARKQNLNVSISIHGPPAWPRGEGVCEYDLGTFNPCGTIKQKSFEIFRNALYDFSYYLAHRYPDVEYWIVYNEPNLPYAFLPEKPYPGGTLLGAYIDLIYWPISDGLKDSGNNIKLVGPEITFLDVQNEYGRTRWLDDWITPLLRDYPDYFDVIGVHSYTIDAYQTIDKMEQFRKERMKYNPLQRVWMTEFNFGTDKERLTKTDSFIFTNLLVFYSHQWWERSYFFSMMNSLIENKSENFGAPKPLYYLFQLLVKYFN